MPGKPSPMGYTQGFSRKTRPSEAPHCSRAFHLDSGSRGTLDLVFPGWISDRVVAPQPGVYEGRDMTLPMSLDSSHCGHRGFHVWRSCSVLQCWISCPTGSLCLCICLYRVCVHVLVCVRAGETPLTGAAFLAVLRTPLLGVVPSSSGFLPAGGEARWAYGLGRESFYIPGVQETPLCLSLSSPSPCSLPSEARVWLVLGCVVHSACPHLCFDTNSPSRQRKRGQFYRQGTG